MTSPPCNSRKLLEKKRRRLLRAVHRLTAPVALLTTLAWGREAAAQRPYVVLRDDGTLSAKITDNNEALAAVMKAYDANGAPRPNILSVWTSFKMSGNDQETMYLPSTNDITGI